MHITFSTSKKMIEQDSPKLQLVSLAKNIPYSAIGDSFSLSKRKVSSSFKGIKVLG